MTPITGDLRKMATAVGAPVDYAMRVGPESIPLKDVIGKSITLHFTGSIHCVHCGRSTRKSFNQGYCYPCFRKLAQCDSCIMSPEKCHFDQGTCREPAWGEQNCMIEHVVYLAHTSGVKVGITRATQIPTRWIDQGAVQALPLLRVATRRLSGLAERLLGEHVSDRTQWRAMLQDVAPEDLRSARSTLLSVVAPALSQLQSEYGLQAVQQLEQAEPVAFSYPVLEWPKRVQSIDAEKQMLVAGTLLGIKGQYLMLDTGVINIRKYTAYEVAFSGG